MQDKIMIQHICKYNQITRPFQYSLLYLFLFIYQFLGRCLYQTGNIYYARVFNILVPDLVPVPLTLFRSKSKFDQNLKCSILRYAEPITTIFYTRHDRYTVVTCADFVVIDWEYFKPEHFEFWWNFKFDRKNVSGTGAWPRGYDKYFMYWIGTPMIPACINTLEIRYHSMIRNKLSVIWMNNTS